MTDQRDDSIGDPSPEWHWRLPAISRRGTICYLFFLVFSLLGRILYPYGDEPDFVIRSVQASAPADQAFWDPFLLGKEILPQPNLAADCTVESGPLSLAASIQGNDCTEPVERLLRRFAWVVVFTLPVAIAVIFRRFFAKLVGRLGVRHDDDEWRLRLDVLALSMLLPSSVYYMGVFSVEPFVLTLGYLAFLTAGSWLVFAAIMTYGFALDMGNTVVMLFCYGCIAVLWTVYRKAGPWLCAGVALAGFAAAYVLNLALVSTILVAASRGPLTLKGEAVLAVLTQSDFYTKYPLLLRPVVSFMTFCFMTAGFVKVPLLYILLGAVALTLTYKAVVGMVHDRSAVKYTRKHSSMDFGHGGFRNVAFVGAMLSVLIIGILLPPYVNFKYYAFLIPVFLVTAVNSYKPRSIILFCCAAQFLVFAHLLYYRYA